jgi:hypothetical protein
VLGVVPVKPKRSVIAIVVNPSLVLTPMQTLEQSLRTKGDFFCYVPIQINNNNNIITSQPPYHDKGRARDGEGRGVRGEEQWIQLKLLDGCCMNFFLHHN